VLMMHSLESQHRLQYQCMAIQPRVYPFKAMESSVLVDAQVHGLTLLFLVAHLQDQPHLVFGMIYTSIRVLHKRSTTVPLERSQIVIWFSNFIRHIFPRQHDIIDFKSSSTKTHLESFDFSIFSHRMVVLLLQSVLKDLVVVQQLHTQ